MEAPEWTREPGITPPDEEVRRMGQDRVRLTWELTEDRGKDDECGETSHIVSSLSVSQRKKTQADTSGSSIPQLGFKSGRRSHVRMPRLIFCRSTRISKRKGKMIDKALIFYYR